MAHFCVFWRGICTFGEEFVCFGEEIHARPPPAGKIFHKILAFPPPAGKFFKFSPPNPPRPNWRGKIPRPRNSPPLNFSPRRGLDQILASFNEASGEKSSLKIDLRKLVVWLRHLNLVKTDFFHLELQVVLLRVSDLGLVSDGTILRVVYD